MIKFAYTIYILYICVFLNVLSIKKMERAILRAIEDEVDRERGIEYEKESERWRV